MEVLTRQPTMRLAYTSITKATYSQPCQVETYVKSDTHSWLGRSALNCRLTRSSGHGAFMSRMVVRTTLPRRTPCKPRRFINRSTVQQAMTTPSRFICFQILSAP